MFLYTSAQYVGTGTLGYYSTYIFLGTEDSQMINSPDFMLEVRALNLFLGLIQLPTAILASYLADRIGRRTMLLIGTGCITFLLFSFAYFGLQSAGFQQRICFVLLTIFVSLADGVALSIYISELVPPKGNSILNTYDNLNQQIITFSFPMLVNTPEEMSTAFIGFGVVGLICFPLLYIFVKETKNKSLYEIYHLFYPQAAVPKDIIDDGLTIFTDDIPLDKITAPISPTVPDGLNKSKLPDNVDEVVHQMSPPLLVSIERGNRGYGILAEDMDIKDLKKAKSYYMI